MSKPYLGTHQKRFCSTWMESVQNLWARNFHSILLWQRKFHEKQHVFSEARRELLCWKWAQWNSCALKGFSSTSSLWWFILDIFSNHKFIEKKSTNKNSSKCLRDFGFHKGFEVLHWFSKNLPPFRFGTTPQTLASHNSGSLERRFLMAFLGKENRPCFCLRFPKKDTRNAG